MPAVYTDYARAVGNGTRMFTVDDIRTSDCILRALGSAMRKNMGAAVRGRSIGAKIRGTNVF